MSNLKFTAKDGKFEGEGKFSFKEIDFSEMYPREVKNCNKTSSRVYLPKELEGRIVYIFLKKEERKNGRKR